MLSSIPFDGTGSGSLGGNTWTFGSAFGSSGAGAGTGTGDGADIRRCLTKKTMEIIIINSANPNITLLSFNTRIFLFIITKKKNIVKKYEINLKT